MRLLWACVALLLAGCGGPRAESADVQAEIARLDATLPELPADVAALEATATAEVAAAAGGHERARIARNEFQDRLIRTSDGLCRAFEARLLASALADAPARLPPGLRPALPLGADGRGPSGPPSDLAGLGRRLASLVVLGIEVERDAAGTAIRRAQGRDVDAYPLACAREDAFVYHGLCNTAAGSAAAAQSLKDRLDPNLESLRAGLVRILERAAAATGRPSLPAGGPPPSGGATLCAVHAASTPAAPDDKVNEWLPVMHPQGGGQ